MTSSNAVDTWGNLPCAGCGSRTAPRSACPLCETVLCQRCSERPYDWCCDNGEKNPDGIRFEAEDLRRAAEEIRAELADADAEVERLRDRVEDLGSRIGRAIAPLGRPGCMGILWPKSVLTAAEGESVTLTGMEAAAIRVAHRRVETAREVLGDDPRVHDEDDDDEEAPQ